MSVWEIRYLILGKKGKDKRMVEFVVAADYEEVLRYFREQIAGENIAFEMISCACPVVRILS